MTATQGVYRNHSQPLPILWRVARVFVIWGVLLWAGAVRGQNQALTFGYSNLLDGAIQQQNGFTQYEMVLATEEALSLWAQYIPLDFIETPDGGSIVTDIQYSDAGLPKIRIGHHDLDANTLAHAYAPGSGGLAYDVHMDGSNRSWSEALFLTTVTHELGHAIGIDDHIEGVTAIMNATLGAANGNLLPGLGKGFLFQPDIDAAQAVWGAGTGEVTTQRIWSGTDSNNWAAHENWDQGWRPTPTSNVLIQNQATVYVTDSQAARSLSMGGAVNRMEISPRGFLEVRQDVVLGTLDGGQELIADAAAARTLIPTSPDLGDSWIQPDFDDQEWIRGETGVGFDNTQEYRPFIGTDVQAQMRNINASLYTRIEFDVQNPAELDFLALRMRYDDGFVAYLNGAEIAAANEPNTLDWNSRATAQREDQDAVRLELFEISDALPNLVAGRNVLSIHGLNIQPRSSDMLISPVLTGGVIDQEIRIDRGSLDVSGNLIVAAESASRGKVIIENGTLTVAGNINQGQGASTLELRGGTVRVEGAPSNEIAIDIAANAKSHVPTNGELQLDWTQLNFDDSSWTDGPIGIGYEREADYGRFIRTDIESEIFDENGSFYTRIEFNLNDANAVNQLLLDMRFDDGFVAFLNGQRVAAANEPEDLSWNSLATESVDDLDNISPIQFDLSDHLAVLEDGKNVLAIQGLNNDTDSSDLLLLPQLSWRHVGGRVSIKTLDFYGGQILDVNSIEARFRHHEGRFSPSLPASDGERPGQLTIVGSYEMSADAELQMNLDGVLTDQHDSIRVEGNVQLGGRLSIAVNENGGEYLDPVEPGNVDRILLMTANLLDGEFSELLYDGQPLEGHQGEGLFRYVVQSEQEISLLNYRAYSGDANGDGSFNSTDFIQVFQAAEYEDDLLGNSDWTEGDWTGDMDFTSEDLVVALQAGSYENGEAFALAVPEPSSGGCLIGLALVACWGRSGSIRTRARTGPASLPSIAINH